MELKLDCRHFRGDKPCRYHCGCAGCQHYEPMGKRILIIKLDAIGDVARTTPLLRTLPKMYSPCHITWLTASNAEEMLRENSMIDVLLPYCTESLESLRVQQFDLVLSLDKTPRAAGVAMWVDAPEKLGFGLSKFGTVFPLNPEAEYAFALGLDDELKFRRNRKTYQEIIFECVRAPYAREEYVLELNERDRSGANEALKRMGIGQETLLVGLNLGGGSAFARKMWDANGALGFLVELLNEVDCRVLLFGAEREKKSLEAIMSHQLPRVYNTGTHNTIRRFQALLARCASVVTGDSLGMHLAIAEKRPVIALFGPTCAQEIELYGRGEKIVSPLPCVPCYRPECDVSPTCMESIEPEVVVEAVKRRLAAAPKDGGQKTGG